MLISLILLFKLLTEFPLSLSLSSLCSLSQPSLFSLSTIPSFSSDLFFVLLNKDFKFHYIHYILFHQWHIFFHSVSHHDIFLPRTRSASEVKWSGLVSIYYVYNVCGPKHFFNRTLAIDSPFQTYAVGLLVEFID